MSMNLYWKPVVQDGNALDDKLKFALRKKYGDGFRVRLDSKSVPYLEGLRDAGVNDAEELITAIYDHGEIEVYEE